MSRPTFYLLDGHAMAYRSYFGMMKQGNRFRTRAGVPTGATYGFTRLLLEVIQSYQPTLLALAFDMPDQTLRQQSFANYKVNRKPPPDDLITQFPYIEEMVKKFGIPIYKQAGYDADDLIGTLAQKAEKAGYSVRIITGDRDLFQLITEHIQLLMPSKQGGGFELFDAAKVFERYGYRPDQVVDYKALAGDTSDNIPGVQGIGDKSALTLLQRFGDLDTIYAKLDEVESKWQKKLEAGREDAQVSRQLAQIMTDVEIAFEPEKSTLSDPDHEGLVQLLQDLEFNSILKQLPTVLQHFEAPEVAVAQLEEAQTTPLLRPQVRIPANLDELKTMIQTLAQGPFAYDPETTGLDSLNTQLVGLSFAQSGPMDSAPSWYLPVGHTSELDLSRQLPLAETLALLKPLFENPAIPKYGHNLKFDMNVLSQYGIRVQGIADDTMIADYLLQPANRHGLKELTEVYLQYQMMPITDLIGSGRKKITMDQVALDEAAVYAGADAVATQGLQAYLLPRLKENGLEALYRDIEMPLVAVLAEMEQNGVALDTAFLGELSQRLDQDLRRLEAEIYQAAGGQLNLNSPRQMSVLLFETLGLPSSGIKQNKTTGYSTDVKTLEKLRHRHPIIEKILDYRQLTKLKSTYIDALPQLINPRTGRLHTSFNQTVAATGRLSSSDPNLQNIPIRTELGRQIRKAFVASNPHHCIVSCDYSQIELRLLAHFSQDPLFLEAFRQDRDIHAQTAVELFNLPAIEDVSAEMRRIAKTTNFGIVYGQSAFGLANTLNIPNSEASRIIRRFKERYQGIESYFQATLDFAREKGYVETLFQRRRYLEDINHPNRMTREFAERVAINSPLQGSASDLIKKAMIAIVAWIQTEAPEVKLLIQVHDELVFEIPERLLTQVLPEIQTRMEKVTELRVPLKVDIHQGPNWMEAK